MTSLHTAIPTHFNAALNDASDSTHAPAQALLQFTAVNKTFTVNGKAVEVLRDIHLQVQPGETLALLGASGCGKSTLLRLLAGLDTPTSGSILVGGKPFSGVGKERGIVFQEHRLFPWLTVTQNIALGLVHEGLSANAKQARIDELVRLVGLGGFEKAYPHQLSGGMAQRVAIARGLASSPQILMLDEPLGALDALTRQQMQDELVRIGERSRLTTLLVTHDVEEAIYLADRVVVLAPRPGRIHRSVNVDLARPRDRSSAAFQALREDLLQTLTAISSTIAREVN